MRGPEASAPAATGLVEVVLRECDGGRDGEIRAAPLGMQVEVSELSFERLDDTTALVLAGFDFYASEPASDDLRCDLSATFQLLYHLPALPADVPAQRDFAASRALGDAWPVWRMWLDNTLMMMGLPASRLPPLVPDGAEEHAREAFDHSLKAKRSAKARGKR